MVRIHNTENNEIIDREMNDQELADHKKVLAKIEADKIAEVKKQELKTSVLNRLGLTEEEVASLFS